MRRRLLLIASTAVALAAAIPLSVIATVAMGISVLHWSGVKLTEISWSPSGVNDRLLPVNYPAADINRVGTLVTQHSDMFNQFSYDGHAIIVHAVTDEAERLARQTLADYPLPWRVDRVRYSEQLLSAVVQSAFDNVRRDGYLDTRIVGFDDSVDRDCVMILAVRIDNELFARLANFRDTVCVVYAPNLIVATQDSGGPPGSAYAAGFWDPATLPGAYWVLLTGFPLHIGAMLLLAALVWTVPWLVRRRRRTRRPPPASTTEPGTAKAPTA